MGIKWRILFVMPIHMAIKCCNSSLISQCGVSNSEFLMAVYQLHLHICSQCKVELNSASFAWAMIVVNDDYSELQHITDMQQRHFTSNSND